MGKRRGGFKSDYYYFFFIYIFLLPSLHKYINPEQAHRPIKLGPLSTHQKPKDKGQAQLQANNRGKQRNTIKSKQNHKQDGKTTT